MRLRFFTITNKKPIKIICYLCNKESLLFFLKNWINHIYSSEKRIYNQQAHQKQYTMNENCENGTK